MSLLDMNIYLEDRIKHRGYDQVHCPYNVVDKCLIGFIRFYLRLSMQLCTLPWVLNRQYVFFPII